MSQKTGIGIFLTAAIITAILLFYAVFAEHSTKDAYFNLLETEEKKQESEQVEEKEENIKETIQEQTICAFVCGSVKKAGIYELSEGARLSDFISAAGGFSKRAEKEYLNLAEKAEDGQRIYVPSKKEAKRWKEKENYDKIESESSQTYKEKVNINTAGKEELMTLSGIGESKAEAILTYRQEKGKFHTIEELMQIPGIKEGTYDKLCNDITI